MASQHHQNLHLMLQGAFLANLRAVTLSTSRERNQGTKSDPLHLKGFLNHVFESYVKQPLYTTPMLHRHFLPYLQSYSPLKLVSGLLSQFLGIKEYTNSDLKIQ